MADAEVLRRGMVEDLARRGELDERWWAAFTDVARHEFIPELVWCYDRDTDGHCDLVPLRRCDDPQRWLEGAYANAPVNTQIDDGHPIGEAGCGFFAELLRAQQGVGKVGQVSVRSLGGAAACVVIARCFLW